MQKDKEDRIKDRIEKRAEWLKEAQIIFSAAITLEKLESTLNVSEAIYNTKGYDLKKENQSYLQDILPAKGIIRENKSINYLQEFCNLLEEINLTNDSIFLNNRIKFDNNFSFSEVALIWLQNFHIYFDHLSDVSKIGFLEKLSTKLTGLKSSLNLLAQEIIYQTLTFDEENIPLVISVEDFKECKTLLTKSNLLLEDLINKVNFNTTRPSIELIKLSRAQIETTLELKKDELLSSLKQELNNLEDNMIKLYNETIDKENPVFYNIFLSYFSRYAEQSKNYFIANKTTQEWGTVVSKGYEKLIYQIRNHIAHALDDKPSIEAYIKKFCQKSKEGFQAINEVYDLITYYKSSPNAPDIINKAELSKQEITGKFLKDLKPHKKNSVDDKALKKLIDSQIDVLQDINYKSLDKSFQKMLSDFAVANIGEAIKSWKIGKPSNDSYKIEEYFITFFRNSIMHCSGKVLKDSLVNLLKNDLYPLDYKDSSALLIYLQVFKDFVDQNPRVTDLAAKLKNLSFKTSLTIEDFKDIKHAIKFEDYNISNFTFFGRLAQQGKTIKGDKSGLLITFKNDSDEYAQYLSLIKFKLDIKNYFGFDLMVVTSDQLIEYLTNIAGHTIPEAHEYVSNLEKSNSYDNIINTKALLNALEYEEIEKIDKILQIPDFHIVDFYEGEENSYNPISTKFYYFFDGLNEVEQSKLLKSFKEKGLSFSSQDVYGNNFFHSVSYNSKYLKCIEVRELIKENPSILVQKNCDGKTPLYQAIAEENNEFLRVALESITDNKILNDLCLLHEACTTHFSYTKGNKASVNFEAIDIILTKFSNDPIFLSQKDKEGYYPIDYLFKANLNSHQIIKNKILQLIELKSPLQVIYYNENHQDKYINPLTWIIENGLYDIAVNIVERVQDLQNDLNPINILHTLVWKIVALHEGDNNRTKLLTILDKLCKNTIQFLDKEYEGNKSTSLQYAIEKKNYEVCEILIKHGTDVNYKTYRINLLSTSDKIVGLLLKNGFYFDLNYEQQYMERASGENLLGKYIRLIQAIRSKNLTEFKSIENTIEKGALDIKLIIPPLKGRKEIKTTLLDFAIRNEATDIISYLLLDNKLPETILTNLEFKGEIVQWLSQNNVLTKDLINKSGLNLNINTKSNFTPEDSIICHIQKMYLLLSQKEIQRLDLDNFDKYINNLKSIGVDINKIYLSGDSLAHKACIYQKIDFLSILLNNGINIEIINQDNLNLLDIALDANYEQSHENLIKFLISKKVPIKLNVIPYITDDLDEDILNHIFNELKNLSLKDIEALQPLHKCAENNNIKVFKKFIKLGCDVNAYNQPTSLLSTIKTPLHIAIENNNIELIKEIIKNEKSDLNVNVTGFPIAFTTGPLNLFAWAIENQKYEVIKCILQTSHAREQVNIKENLGIMLIYAVAENDRECIDYVLNRSQILDAKALVSYLQGWRYDEIIKPNSGKVIANWPVCKEIFNNYPHIKNALNDFITNVSIMDAPKISKDIDQSLKGISKYLPESKYNLGEKKYENLLKYCNQWDKVYSKKMFDSNNLKALIEDENFQKICSTYNELKAENKENAVKKFLLDLVDLGQSEFIIPYAFITHEVPEEYDRIHLGMLGVSKELPDMINDL